MRIGYLVTARLKSTRLPNKLILKIQEREVIRWMIDRLKISTELDEIVICTSTNPQDQPLEEIAKQEKVGIFRGHEEDVIKRLYDAAVEFKLDYILNVTADCPLVSYEYISLIIDSYKNTNADLVRCLDLPHGFFSYGIKVDALKKVCDIKDDDKTEVWGRYFTDTGHFKVVDLDIPNDLKRPDYRLTLDYPEDFKFFEAVFAFFGPETYKTKMKNIIEYLDNHPEIVNINAHCKNAFKKNWDSQNTIHLK